ncbi:MAG TPA: metallophosphoesterase [Longimicrobiales bacterium]|nr:metallophosphoesterase [Longimicrobiales bacterium]
MLTCCVRRAVLLTLVCIASACAAPRAEAPAEPVRAVVISDLNASYGSTRYATEVGEAVRHIVQTWQPDVVLIAGDMVAGQSPQLADTTVAAMWQAFDSVVAAPLRTAGIPIIATPGNHDASAYPAHARDRRMAVEYWRSSPHPTAPDSLLDREHYPLRYTARHGNVFIVSWDATNQESATSDELTGWLEQKLRSPEAIAADHRVVLGHLPLYAVAEGRDRAGEVLTRGDELRRQFEEWGATLFISGHHHAYYPGRRGTLQLLHSGALGGGPRQLLGTSTPPLKTVSVLEFLPDSLGITTYDVDADDDGPDVIPIERLPRAICGSSGWVARRDLVALDTTCTAP